MIPEAPQKPQRNIFICYSHKDEKYRDMLRQHLKYAEKAYGLDIFDSKSIQPGEKWRQRIDSALASTKVAVLLISANFLASEFIAKQELPVLLQAAQEKKITLISVLIRHSVFDDTPLAKFQVANVTPLAYTRSAKRDEVLTQIARTIVEQLSGQNNPPDVS